MHQIQCNIQITLHETRQLDKPSKNSHSQDSLANKQVKKTQLKES
ncbi:conserved hypothetical protein [Vibrio crassostreae]|nr:conserved hypothetical protein [Vibrio crassostreae]CAK2443122.1 conserved hypothetical protein [Vibrio crassostreae]CAK2998925.1 conserved hypothetical protein [Vibrio crassostreae]